MSSARIERFPLETFDRWFPFFEIIPALVVFIIVLILGNALLGLKMPTKRRITVSLIDIGCAVFALLLGEWGGMVRFPALLMPAVFAVLYAAYFLKRKTYPDISKGRPAVLALWDFSILLIALAFWSFVRTTLFCMCL